MALAIISSSVVGGVTGPTRGDDVVTSVDSGAAASEASIASSAGDVHPATNIKATAQLGHLLMMLSWIRRILAKAAMTLRTPIPTEIMRKSESARAPMEADGIRTIEWASGLHRG
jgi:hypothetical protein